MVSSSKLKPGIVALFAVGVVQQATALPQIELGPTNFLTPMGVEFGSDLGDCKAVAAALNSLKLTNKQSSSSLKYNSSSISGVDCYQNQNAGWTWTLRADDCKAVAAALNSLKYGSSSISGVYCETNRFTTGLLMAGERKDVELLNTLLEFSEREYFVIEANVTDVTANALPQIKLNHDSRLRVESGSDDCKAVAAALNSLKYGSSSISGVTCVGSGWLYVFGSDDCVQNNCVQNNTCELCFNDKPCCCKADAAALNSFKYGSSTFSGMYCPDQKNRDNDGSWLMTDEPKDVELLNTILAFSEKGYSGIEANVTANDPANDGASSGAPKAVGYAVAALVCATIATVLF